MSDNFKEAFIEEAEVLLDELEYSLLELEIEENQNDSELIAKVFRALHTLKGSSGMFGFDEISLFIHDIETVYDYIRKGELNITQEIIGLTLSAKDRIKEMLFGHTINQLPDNQSIQEILSAFKRIVNVFNSQNKYIADNSRKKSVLPDEIREPGNQLFTYLICFKPLPDFFSNGTNPINLLNELRRLGHSKIMGFIDSVPCLDQLDPVKSYIYWELILTTKEGPDAIKDVFMFVDEEMCSLDIKQLDTHGKLNNKMAYKLLGQLLNDKHEISPKDVIAIIQKTEYLNNSINNDNIYDFEKLEKLKEHYRKHGLIGLVGEISNEITEINDISLKLEGDAGNQNYLNHISQILTTLADISIYAGIKGLNGVTLSLIELINCFIGNSVNIDSATTDVFLQSIDYLNEILDNILTNTPSNGKKEIVITIDELISKYTKINSGSKPEPEENPDTIDSIYLKDFLISTIDMVESLEQSVLSYEKTDELCYLNEIFRIVHTLKSDSMVAGLNNLGSYTNILENLLHKLRNGQIKRTEVIIDLILTASGTIRNTIEELNKNNYNIIKSRDIQILKDLILVYDNGKETGNARIGKTVSEADPKSSAYLNQIIQYKEMLAVSANDRANFEGKSKIIKRLLLNLENVAKYMKHAELLNQVNELNNIVNGGKQIEIEKGINSLIEYLSTLLNEEFPSVNTAEITNPDNESDILSEIPQVDVNDKIDSEKGYPIKEKLKTGSEVENKAMRVDESKINSFSNMIGELVIARNSYEYLLNEVYSHNKLEQGIEKKLNDNLHLFSRLSNELQVGVMTLRMVPLKGIFQKYSRVVRDISKKQNKKIDLIIIGGETEIDKKIADLLSDPLIHLIRNSCDHGIEKPEERLKHGKSETGNLTLKAAIEGDKLVIVVSDDGKGLDRQKIYEKAVKIGIDIEKYDNNTILDLIFEPGFSTKTEVSELSGRGVGMDVVKTTIDKLGGSINVKTEENIGTEVSFVIPMSIGLSDSLLVEANEEIYAIPVLSVVKTLKLIPSQLFRLHDRFGFNHRGEILPAATLSELLNGKSGTIEERINSLKEKKYIEETDEISAVVVQTKKGNFGILVDKLIRNIELSIKPVPECISKSNVISGVSILGNGNVVLVLNPEKLV